MTETKTLFKKSSIRPLLVTIGVFIIIYLTDTLLFATSTVSYFTLARRFVPVAAAAAMLFFIKRFSLPFVFVVISIAVSLSLFMANNSGYFYISVIALLLCGYGCSFLISLEEFEDAFIKIMRVIAIVSLITFFFGATIKLISFIPTVTNSAGYDFKVLFLSNIPLSESRARRNCGPFWEPGVYQIYLNIAIIFVLHRQKKTMWFDSVLFLTTLLTTLSGASILPLPFIIMAYLISNLKNKSAKPFILVFVVLCAVVLLFQTGAFDEIITKVTGEDGGLSSGFRLGSAWANLVATVRYPFFGASPEVQDQLRMEIIYSINGYYTEGNTNTMIGYFAYFGVFVGAFFCIKIFSFCKRISQNFLGALCLFVAMVIMTSNENLILSALPYVLMFILPEKDKNSTKLLNKT